MKIARAQAAALEQRIGVPTFAAGRLWEPYPSDVLSPIERWRRVISLPLAPQSVHVYHDFVAGQLEDRVEVVRVPAYGLEPKLVAAFVNAIEETARGMPATGCAVILTAHSLPLRVLQAGDPYQTDFEAMAGAIRALLVDRGISAESIRVGYQSQGMSGGDWLGPDLATVFEDVRKDGHRAILMAPVGFVAEHVETLFDIDVEAAAMARELGFEAFERMPAMNVRGDFIDALEAVARRALEHV